MNEDFDIEAWFDSIIEEVFGEGPVSCWRQGKSPAGLPSPLKQR